MNAKRLWMLVLAASLLGGCIEREMKITSQPEGALVYVSGVEKGRTPLTMPFTWYGDYEVILRMEGYDTVTASEQIYPPWYAYPPLDLLSELAPWRYEDNRYLHYDLVARQSTPKEELIRRAEAMQQRNLEPVKR